MSSLKSWWSKLIVLLFVAQIAGMITAKILNAENALMDGNGNPSIIVEDSATAGDIIRIKGDVATGALLVSGLASASCSAREIKKYAIPATSDSGSNLLGTATSTLAFIQNESLGDVYFIENAAAAAATGMMIGPRGNFGISAANIRQIHVYNSQSATATVSVLYCY